jgi:hypothetical protein
LCGFAVWTPRGFDWVYTKFISDPVKGYEVVQAVPKENSFLLAKVPEYYNRLQSSYDDALFRQEVLGEYLPLNAGLVYRAFARNVHVADVPLRPGLPLLWALDFNVTPMSSVVAQMVQGKLHVVDEIVLSPATTEEACAEFRRRYFRNANEVVVYGDASGFTQSTSGVSDYEIVEANLQAASMPVKLRVDRKNPPVRARVNTMNSVLRNAEGRVSMLVDRKCKELIKDFEQVVYRAESMEIDKERDRFRTHTSDALGYLVWKECGARQEVGERNQPLL